MSLMDEHEPSAPSEALPPRLASGRGPSGSLLRRYLRQDRAPDEARSWNKLVTRMSSVRDARNRRTGFLAGALLVAGAAVFGVLWWPRPEAITSPAPELISSATPARPAPPPLAAGARGGRSAFEGARREVPATPPSTSNGDRPGMGGAAAGGSHPRAERLRLTARPRALAPGESQLEGQARVWLSSAGAARASLQGGGARFELLAGTIGLEVQPQPPGKTLQVVVAPFRFVVLGTRFRVLRRDDRVLLDVREGKVAVLRGARRLAVVAGGGRWQSRLASGPGLAAEVDLYDRAFALREAGDLPGALASLREHRRRFPAGHLAPEVALSITELAARMGDHREALATSARLLAGSPAGERAAELHLLRGDVLREGEGDCAAAEQEYAQAARQAGRWAGAARYWQGRCLEVLGRREEAVAAYRAARAGSDERLVADASKRLARLSSLNIGAAEGSKQE